MRSLAVAFHINAEGKYEKLVDWIAGSPTHCELVFPDGKCFSSSNRDGGCRFKNIEFTPGHWSFIDIPNINVDAVHSFCTSIEGSRYDFLGILAGKFGIHVFNRWFCSEVCTMGLLVGNKPTGLTPHSTSPKELYSNLIATYGVPYASYDNNKT